jgi:hypothetical protein
MKMPMMITSIEFCHELAEVGIIPKDMLNNITNAKILLSPSNGAILSLEIVLDERIYEIVNPRVRKMFTVEQQEQERVMNHV